MVAKEDPTLKGIFFALLAHKNQYNLNGKQSETCRKKMISAVQSRFSDIKFSDLLFSDYFAKTYFQFTT